MVTTRNAAVAVGAVVCGVAHAADLRVGRVWKCQSRMATTAYADVPQIPHRINNSLPVGSSLPTPQVAPQIDSVCSARATMLRPSMQKIW